MPEIKTLIPDIYRMIEKKGEWFTDAHAREYADHLSKRLTNHLTEDGGKPRLRLSGMGARCPKALWHSIHTPELAAPLPPWATIKYSFGHTDEALVLTLAKAAGHEVTGEQDHVSVDDVSGHRDCVIDGHIVDVKSLNSRSFEDFRRKQVDDLDKWGYLSQLDGYMVGSLEDPLVRVKDVAYLFIVDRTLGKMLLYRHELREKHIRERIADYKRIVSLPAAPACTCGVVADGKSGNLCLDTKASYSAYKYCCFPQLRTFLYASGPVYLTHVARKPDVPEVNSKGVIIN